MEYLGIDIGGSAIKAGIVDIKKRDFNSELKSIPVDRPQIEQILDVLGSLIKHFSWQKKTIGIGFPGVIKKQKIITAANLDVSCIGYDISDYILKAFASSCFIVNDADAAGLAEINLTLPQNSPKTVLFLTFGTGIGSALFFKGELFPNTELGHLIFKGEKAEKILSAMIKVEKKMSFESWGLLLNEYLNYLYTLFWPDAFVIGGAISKDWGKYVSFLNLPVLVKPAHFLGDSGILGAAWHAYQSENKK